MSSNVLSVSVAVAGPCLGIYGGLQNTEQAEGGGGGAVVVVGGLWW